MDTFLQDLRYAFRQLRRSPGFALTAILTLTMAIGANVVVFGIVHSLVLRSLLVADAGRVYSIQPKNGVAISYPNFEDIRDRNKAFSGVSVVRIARVGLDSSGSARPVWGYEVSGNYFEMLGIKPVVGRFFTPAEDTKINGDPYVVLSYNCWKTQFGGDPGVAGRTVRVNKHPYVVLGVAPKNFNGTERFIWPEVWVPIHNEPEIEGYDWIKYRGAYNAWVVARLKPGVTAQQANADLASIAGQLSNQYPDEDKGLELHLAQAGFLGDFMGKAVHGFLLGVMLLAGLVLLAACVNLGGLFAAHISDRAKEIGIRIAIGSSRRRILRQLITESACLSVAGGVISACLAAGLLHALTMWHPQTDFPIQVLVEPDAVVYLYAALISLATGFVFGMIPARQIWKTDPNQVLKAAGAGAMLRRFSLRDILLAVQIALCCLLVTASFVALRGLQRTLNMPLGIHPEGVTLAAMDTHLAGYEDSGEIQKKLLDAVRQVPGITGATLVNSMPLAMNQSEASIYAPGTTSFIAANQAFSANYYEVSPGYFALAGTRLLAGRDFSEHDDAKSTDVAIVNTTFAKRLFGTTDAVGKTYPDGPGHQFLVVGVVEAGKYGTLTEDPAPVVFWPIAQRANSDTVLLVRSHRSSAEIMAAMRSAIASVDPGLPIFSLTTWPDVLSLVTFPARAATIALGVLGMLAMMLAVTGIFGMASYTVSKRMRELGIRVALGAQNMHVLRAALGRVVLLLGIGSVAGIVLGAAASRVLASIVYQASAADPWVMIAVVATMGLIGLGSAAVPAGRALGAEPAKLLHDE
jgi:predicted permease